MWSEELIKLLLLRYEQHENLYNIKHFDYQNPVKRSKSLFEICEYLKELDGNITVEDIKVKIHYLRSQFIIEHRKTKARGFGQGDVYVPKLWYYPLMLFLDSHTNLRSQSKLCQENEHEVQEVEPEDSSFDNSLSYTLQLNENVCRICLQHNAILNWEDEIFDFNGSSYKDCYYKYSKLEESVSDCLPTNLCEICANGLKNAHLLFEKALKSYRVLQVALTAQTLKVEYSDTEICNDEHVTNFEISIFKYDEDINRVDDNAVVEELESDVNFVNVYKNENLAETENVMNDAEQASAPEYITIEPIHFIDLQNFETSASSNSLGHCKRYCTETISTTKRVHRRKKRKLISETSSQFSESCNTVLSNPSATEKTAGEEKSVIENLLEQNLSNHCDIKTSAQLTANQAGKKKLFMCAYCSVFVKKYSELKDHEAIHSKDRKRTEICPHCGIKLYNKAALNGHVKIHDENRKKKYKCEFCEKAFFNGSGLNIHKRIHLGLMVKCPICSKEFYRQVDLNRHLPKHSVSPAQKNAQQLKYKVQCQYCNKSVFTYKWKDHKAAHLNQPQVKCKICEKPFFSRQRCVEHLRKRHHKTKNEYNDFIHYYEYYTRMTHLMIQQQEKVQQLTELAEDKQS